MDLFKFVLPKKWHRQNYSEVKCQTSDLDTQTPKCFHHHSNQISEFTRIIYNQGSAAPKRIRTKHVGGENQEKEAETSYQSQKVD